MSSSRAALGGAPPLLRRRGYPLPSTSPLPFSASLHPFRLASTIPFHHHLSLSRGEWSLCSCRNHFICCFLPQPPPPFVIPSLNLVSRLVFDLCLGCVGASFPLSSLVSVFLELGYVLEFLRLHFVRGFKVFDGCLGFRSGCLYRWGILLVYLYPHFFVGC